MLHPRVTVVETTTKSLLDSVFNNLGNLYITRPVLHSLREDQYFRRDFTFQQTFSTSFHPEHREGLKLVEKVETLSSFVEKFS